MIKRDIPVLGSKVSDLVNNHPKGMVFVNSLLDETDNIERIRFNLNLLKLQSVLLMNVNHLSFLKTFHVQANHTQNSISALPLIFEKPVPSPFPYRPTDRSVPDARSSFSAILIKCRDSSKSGGFFCLGVFPSVSSLEDFLLWLSEFFRGDLAGKTWTCCFFAIPVETTTVCSVAFSYGSSTSFISSSPGRVRTGICIFESSLGESPMSGSLDSDICSSESPSGSPSRLTFLVVESLLSKVVEECERRVLIQHEMVYACFFFIMFSFIINDTFTQVFCSDEHSNNMLDKLHATRCNWKGPISYSDVGRLGSGAQYTYDRFPSNIRTEKQLEEKRKQILAAASSAFEYLGRHTPG
ncbi:DENN domain and WD repeat-containing protein SCD1 [Senna tora]|uniref:DENN domain and WD repeat-containing protein SCD1 n=1 Tax=Senna tora TaxID=362788 RepID=A0A835CA46_9FABA|nr:DENN domain and WD repeat-containing protein SCD1 [Senna tora]